MEYEISDDDLSAVDSGATNVESSINYTRRKKKPHIYSKQEDINLLKEVAASRPFGEHNIKIWNEIHARLKIKVMDGFALKRHFETLLKTYKKDNQKNINGSGTEKDYCEKTQLLQNLNEFIEGLKESEELQQENLLKSQKQKESSDKKAAKKIRESAMKTMADRESLDADLTAGSGSKKKKLDLNQMLQEKEKATIKIEQEKLKLKQDELELAKNEQILKYDMENKRLELEEKRLNQIHKEYEDKREYEKLKMQMDMEERKVLLSALGRCLQNNPLQNL